MTFIVRTRPRRSSRDALLGYAMLTPAVICLSLLIVVPVASSIVLALFEWSITDIGGPKPFVGLGNIARLASDPMVVTALVNTVTFVVASVSSQLVLGFAIASALFEINRGRRLANAVILLPMIIAPVVTALLWRYLLDPKWGLVSQLLYLTGVATGVDWFGSYRLALAGLVIVDIWQWTPFVILVFHAGMLSISPELFEAAKVDGASLLRVSRSIVLPALQPLILLVLLFRTIDTYRIFDTVFVLTRGGPGLATETIAFYTYRTGFSHFDMGYAMALSMFMLATVMVIAAIYIRLLRQRGVFR